MKTIDELTAEVFGRVYGMDNPVSFYDVRDGLEEEWMLVKNVLTDIPLDLIDDLRVLRCRSQMRVVVNNARAASVSRPSFGEIKANRKV